MPTILLLNIAAIAQSCQQLEIALHRKVPKEEAEKCYQQLLQVAAETKEVTRNLL